MHLTFCVTACTTHEDGNMDKKSGAIFLASICWYSIYFSLNGQPIEQQEFCAMLCHPSSKEEISIKLLTALLLMPHPHRHIQ